MPIPCRVSRILDGFQQTVLMDMKLIPLFLGLGEIWLQAAQPHLARIQIQDNSNETGSTILISDVNDRIANHVAQIFKQPNVFKANSTLKPVDIFSPLQTSTSVPSRLRKAVVLQRVDCCLLRLKHTCVLGPFPLLLLGSLSLRGLFVTFAGLLPFRDMSCQRICSSTSFVQEFSLKRNANAPSRWLDQCGRYVN